MTDSAFWIADLRFDWEKFIVDNGGMRALKSQTSEYIMVCPDCDKPKLAVNIRQKRWQCFVCNEGGYDTISLIAKVLQCPWYKAIELILVGDQCAIGSTVKLELDLKDNQGSKLFIPKEISYPDGFYYLDAAYGSYIASMQRGQRIGQVYCNQRMISPFVSSEMRLGVCTKGRFKDRLIFPVFDIGGRLIFYQGRAMWKDPSFGRYIKTLSVTQQVNKAQDPITSGAADCLLNLYPAVQAAKRVDPENMSILVTEGPIDCAHAWPDAVATFGKKLSSRQIELLVRAGVKSLDLCWDSDAVQEMMKLAPSLRDLFNIRIVQLPVGKDPGDCTKDEIEYYRAQAFDLREGQATAYRLGAIE